jgi:alanyl-tRNA synthetase
MQQHTGQHLLSAAFEQLLGANTVAFHLGSELCTIDLDQAKLSPEAIAPVEELVNQIIWEDRPVIARSASQEELPDVNFRFPQKSSGPVRLVEVADFDLNPCGGTHVSRSGEIGLLKVIRPDYRADETRIEFVCGKRALQDYGIKNQTLLQLAGRMTVGYWELGDALGRLEEELKQTRRDLRTATERVVEYEAAELIQQASDRNSLTVVQRVWEKRDPGALRLLASKLIDHPNVVALLASLGERTHLCIARSEGVAVDAAVLLGRACEQLEGKGGGQSHFAQGSAPATDLSRIEEVLEGLPISP